MERFFTNTSLLEAYVFDMLLKADALHDHVDQRVSGSLAARPIRADGPMTSLNERLKRAGSALVQRNQTTGAA